MLPDPPKPRIAAALAAKAAAENAAADRSGMDGGKDLRHGSDSSSGSTPSSDSASPSGNSAVEKAAGAKATGIVALAIMCSRVLGLLRELIFAALFDSRLRDCFIAAFRIPNMLRDLFAEGALSTAFVTVFSQKMKTEGDQAAWRLAHRMISLATVVMSGISLLGILLSPVLVRVMATGWEDADPWKIEYTVGLTRIMFPFILLVSLAALVMGILNSRKVYGAPAMASSYFNLVSILGGAGLGWIMDPKFGPNAMVGFSIGTLLGGLAQLGVQLPALKREGYRFAFTRDWKNPDVRRILQLMWPAVIAGSAVQVNVMMNSVFASELAQKDGPMSWLNYAFRLMQLPLGVFGVAVATVTLPVLSRVATEGITEKFRSVLGAGNRLVLFLTLPAAVGLFVLAEPIISVIYERGKFSAWETVQTAAALRWYSVGLIFYAGIKVVQPAFTAIDRRFVPMYVALGSIALNAGLNSLFVFYFHFGHDYLALSTAVIAGVNFTLLYYSMCRTAGGLYSGKLLTTLLKLLPGTAALGLVAWAGLHWGLAEWAQSGFPRRAISLGLIIAAAGSAYIVLALAMRVEEAGEFLSMVKRRAGRAGGK